MKSVYALLCMVCVVSVPLAFAEAGSDVLDIMHLSDEQRSGLLISAIECEVAETLYVLYGDHPAANAPLCLTYREYKSLSDAGVDLRPYWNIVSSGMVLETVHLGLIAPLNGGAWTYGVDIVAGARLAEEDANAMLANASSTWRIDISLVDSMTNPEYASLAVATFANNNYDIIVGPSIDIFGDVSQYAPDSLMVSCCSVTLQHSKDDNIFRMTPPQPTHGVLMAQAA